MRGSRATIFWGIEGLPTHACSHGGGVWNLLANKSFCFNLLDRYYILQSVFQCKAFDNPRNSSKEYGILDG